MRRLLGNLHRLGSILAMNNFGTGYSSLAYLAKSPVHQLKPDGALLLNL
ncbi:MAG: EAL domain-containing protein [Rheinheimera sp.]|nr:MAG: EAL domain-containing protein [Rheinheimera sp.]